jgi:MFS family permease
MADAESQPQPTQFGAYLFTNGAWFLAFGVQVVLFPYLVRVVLGESEVRFGYAQMALQLPTALFILLGGFVADRVDGKRLVIAACWLAVGTFALLGAAVISGALTYELIIAYAVVVGVMSAFATPARDALLSLMAPEPSVHGVQRAVSMALLSQFGGQLIGMAFAAGAAVIGVGALLIGQAGLMALAAVSAARFRPRPREHAAKKSAGNPIVHIGREIGSGFAAAFSSRAIAPVMICSMAMGACFMGAFFVLLPLIVQSYFPPDARAEVAGALGVFSLCFWTGSIVSAFALMRFGPLQQRGLTYLAALTTGSIVLIVCSIPAPFWVLCTLNFVWGLGGGVAMTLGRGIVQEHAPAAARARILSIFTLTLMATGPLGAVAYGYLAHAIGPHAAILVPGFGMLTIVTGVYLFTDLRRLAHAPIPA